MEHHSMLRRSIVPSFAIACMGSVAAAAELTVIEAPGGYMTSVSADGSVVAGYGGQYFYWTKRTGTIFIGGIAPGDQGAGGSPGVSADGTRVCGNVLNNDGKVEAAIWPVGGSIGSWSGTSARTATSIPPPHGASPAMGRPSSAVCTRRSAPTVR